MTTDELDVQSVRLRVADAVKARVLGLVQRRVGGQGGLERPVMGDDHHGLVRADDVLTVAAAQTRQHRIDLWIAHGEPRTPGDVLAGVRVRRGDEQRRAMRMMDERVGDAAEQARLHRGTAMGAGDDERRVDLVGDVEDRLPDARAIDLLARGDREVEAGRAGLTVGEDLGGALLREALEPSIGRGRLSLSARPKLSARTRCGGFQMFSRIAGAPSRALAATLSAR